jgi:hypothetical protein
MRSQLLVDSGKPKGGSLRRTLRMGRPECIPVARNN